MKIARAFTLLIVCCAGIAFMPLMADAKASTQYVEAFRQTINQILAADSDLYLQMQYAAKRMTLYYQKYGHFPRSGVEQDKFIQSVLRHFNFNPYRPKVTELYYKQQPDEDTKSHLYILTDPLITLERLRAFRKNAPDSWKAEPGTIMILTNGEGTFAVWGTSADRLPLRDYERGNRLKMICRDLAAEEAQRATY